MSDIIPIIVVLLNCIVGAYAALFLKKGSKKSLLSKNIVIGIFLYGISAVIFIACLRFAPVSILYPVTSATYIWSFVLAKKYLNEKITRQKLVGLCLIILGIVLLSLL